MLWMPIAVPEPPAGESRSSVAAALWAKAMPVPASTSPRTTRDTITQRATPRPDETMASVTTGAATTRIRTPRPSWTPLPCRRPTRAATGPAAVMASARVKTTAPIRAGPRSRSEARNRGTATMATAMDPIASPAPAAAVR